MSALDTASLAARYGTPLYVYRLDRAAAAWRDLTAALPEPSLLHYSLKANPHPDLVRKLIGLGARPEISSPAELDIALDGGAPAHECLYTGPAKSHHEIAYAASKGVRRFSVESEQDYLRVGRAAAVADTRVECLVRLNGHPSGATGLRMSGTASQFGVELDDLNTLRTAFIPSEHTRIAGFHLFPVSNARDEDSLLEALVGSIRHARTAADVLDVELEMVDLGGGFAAPYAMPGDRPVYPALKSALETALDEHFLDWRRGRPRIAFESGRYLAGDCGGYVATVMDVKHSGARIFVVLDGGVNHLGGMAGLGRLLRPSAVPELSGGSAQTVTLVGPLCTPADVLSLNVELPPVAPGDLLVFPNTGAYGLSASLHAFLSRPAPPEIAIDRDVIVSATRTHCSRSTLDTTAHDGTGES